MAWIFFFSNSFFFGCSYDALSATRIILVAPTGNPSAKVVVHREGSRVSHLFDFAAASLRSHVAVPSLAAVVGYFIPAVVSRVGYFQLVAALGFHVGVVVVLFHSRLWGWAGFFLLLA